MVVTTVEMTLDGLNTGWEIVSELIEEAISDVPSVWDDISSEFELVPVTDGEGVADS